MPITINGSGTVTGLSAGGISNTKAIATAALPAGSVLQVLQDTKTDAYGQTCSGTTTYTVTGLEKAITLSDASNKVLITASLASTGSANAYLSLVWWINRSTGGSDNALTLGDQIGSNRHRGGRNSGRPYHDHNSMRDEITWLDTPGSVGPHTYNIQFADKNGDGGGFYINRVANDGDTTDRATCVSSITLTEIKG